jgi:DNA (cytosine-5)-methyltransferase 1
MSKPRLLDLFCGAGGAAMGYHRAGFEVVGVDIKPQKNYPFEFVQGDALEYVQEHGGEFDAIHASPPCQSHSTLKFMPNAREHECFIDRTRELLKATGVPWVIENVPGAPLEARPPSLFSDVSGVTLCGTHFGLNNGTHELRRHRLFEASFAIAQPACNHKLSVIGFYGDHARTRQRTIAGNPNRGGDITERERKLALVWELMGIDWMEWTECCQAIPPAYTEFIGRRLMEELT